MIFKQKFYNSLDHWSDISVFNYKKGYSWSKMANLPIKETITVEDLDKAKEYLKVDSRLYSVPDNFISQPGLYCISTGENLITLYNKDVLNKSEASNREWHINLCVNLETLRILRDYSFESGIFKSIISEVHNTVKLNDATAGPFSVCSDCAEGLDKLVNSYQGLGDFSYVFNITENMTISHKDCVKGINNIFSKIFSGKYLLISKINKNLGLKLKELDYIYTADYSPDFSIAFYDKLPSASSCNKLKILFSNQKNEYLLYTENGVICPYHHYSVSKGYTEKCKSHIPTKSESINLNIVQYGTIDESRTQLVVDSHVGPDFPPNNLFINSLDFAGTVYCKSNTKKINIDIGLLEKINVRQYIRRK